MVGRAVIPQVNITSLYREFSENYDWIESVARLAAGNRFAGVKSRLQNIAQHYDANTNQVTEDFEEREAFLTAFEAKRFNDAVGYLRTLNRHHLPVAKIKSMCKGPAYHLEEVPAIGNSEGRDIQFEFILGAQLKRSGLEIQGFDDIQIAYAASRIRYECKRPATERNIAAKFDEAVEQLAEKVAGQENEYGIVALSIEKAGGFDRQFFRGNDRSGVTDIFGQQRRAALDMLGPRLRLTASKKILGLYLCVNTLLWDRAAGQLTDDAALFTEKAVQVPATPLHSYLFDAITGQLERA
jgi:hypothetical protein